MRLSVVAIQYPPSLETGGKRPWLLVKEFMRSKVEVLVVARRDSSREDRRLALGRGVHGERILRINPCRIPGTNDDSVRIYTPLRRVLQRLEWIRRSQAVIMTGPPFFHFMLTPVLKRAGIRVVLDYRDGWAADPYPYRTIKDWLFRGIGSLVERRIYDSAAGVVFVSDSLRADHLRRIGVHSAEKTAVIPNGVDLDEFLAVPAIDIRAQMGFPSNAGVCVYTGTLSDDIGASEFFRTLDTLLLRHPACVDSWRFVFVGSSPEYRSHLQGGDWQNRVFFVPQVPLRTAYAYIKGADVLLSLGGDHRQRLNRKLFEYAAASAPIVHIGNQHGESAMLIRRLHAGLLVRPNDTDGLRHALVELSSDAKRRCFDTSPRPAATVEFSVKALGARYLEFIRNTCHS